MRKKKRGYNRFEIEIYKKVTKGIKVYTFENYLQGIPLAEDYTERAYDNVKSMLRKDFQKGKLPTKARLPVKKWLTWLWKNGKVKPPYSECRPHMRMVGNYIYYFDGRIKKRSTQDTTVNFYLNEQGYAMYEGKLVHRLMAEAWFKNWNPAYEVNHKDKNRSNNHISNLELVDHNNNILHRDNKPYFSVPREYTNGV
tara:strand:- start:2386 stop:2976 length:591 start_codon:yes stop_codon:yes gene_type:complete